MDQSRRRKFLPNGGRGCLLLSGLVLMILAGCNSDFGSRRQPDPLLGPSSSPTPVPPSNTPGNAPAQTASVDQTPPLPASYTTPSQAAVAAGETATPVPGRPLRIDGDPSAPASVTGNSAVRGAAPTVTVGNPEPANNGSTPRLAAVPTVPPASQSLGAPTSPVADGAGLTFDQAQRLLTQYAVNWQRLDMDNGQWKFQCGIPNPSNPTVNRTYATTKGASDYMSAIREVITQIEKDHH
jgi:hypothetical protein